MNIDVYIKYKVRRVVELSTIEYDNTFVEEKFEQTIIADGTELIQSIAEDLKHPDTTYVHIDSKEISITHTACGTGDTAEISYYIENNMKGEQ